MVTHETIAVHCHPKVNQSRANAFANPYVQLENVSFHYPRRGCGNGLGGAGVRGINDVSFSVSGGDRVVVLGCNGSGKSTLLSLIAGRRKATSGRVTVLGTDAFDNTQLQQHVAFIADPWPEEAFFGTTVNTVVSSSSQSERTCRIAAALDISLNASVDKLSSGQRRTVQILHGIHRRSALYLLDECSTDVDVSTRKVILEMVKKDCIYGKSCCMYATHILDGVSDWATHVMFMHDGRVIDIRLASHIEKPLGQFAYQLLSKRRQAALLTEAQPSQAHENAQVCDDTKAPTACHESALASSIIPGGDVVIACNGLNFKDVFNNLSFHIFGGERVLMCGRNGVGKTTLLNMMGGKQFFDNSAGALRILGRACYDDMSLNAMVSLAGDWWRAPPPCELHVREMLQLDTSRARRLCTLLEVDLDWDVRHISSGERKRVQLLHHLLVERPIVLLDEATSDLDLDMRRSLLSFLYCESVKSGVTVVYATHIFDDLDEWPTTVMVLDRSCGGLSAVLRRTDHGPFDFYGLLQEYLATRDLPFHDF
ncbi:putative ABC transporter [Trypanosoma vivax]|nr:putative ABC transporter [Trypanosoma vivax]